MRSNRIKLPSRMMQCLLFLSIVTAGCLALLLTADPVRSVSAPVDAELVPADGLKGYMIVLDPGHGGYDGGARAIDSGKWEKEINLAIALKAEQALRQCGANVLMTRREDVSLDSGAKGSLCKKRQDLHARVQMSEEAGAAVFVSIHMNEYRSRKESGPQVFYERGADAGRLLAGTLQHAFIETLNPARQRVAMAGDYCVLRGKTPAALVECGFISNPEEERKLLDEDYQRLIAQAIAKGVYEYSILKKNTNSSSN